MHFKSPDGALHFIDPEFAGLLPEGSEPITNGEAAEIRSQRTPYQIRDTAKGARAIAVDSIKVTTQAGNTFDGDEISQGRMARAIFSLRECTDRLAAGDPVSLPPKLASIYRVVDGRYESVWVLSDNSSVYVGASELSEALVLSGAAQAAVWVLPT